jgi:hypothetical protein
MVGTRLEFVQGVALLVLLDETESKFLDKHLPGWKWKLRLGRLVLSPTLRRVFGHKRHGVSDNLFLGKFSVLYESLWDEPCIRPDGMEKRPAVHPVAVKDERGVQLED